MSAADGEALVSERPSEMILTARVARMYYLEDRSKSDIAVEVGISRFKVARLLDLARRIGVVNIDIRSVDSLDADLSLQLRSTWGLEHAVVLDIPDDDHVQLRRQLGESTAQLLMEIVSPNDVLGMAWSRALSTVGDALQRFVPCPVVQLTGALSRPDGSDILGLVRSIARLGGGAPYVFYAPIVVQDASTARALHRQPDVTRAMAQVPGVTIALVAVGSWASGLSTIYDNVEPADRLTAAKAGVVAEISGIFIDETGKAVRPPLRRRIVGIASEDLAKVRTVLAIAYDEAKADATRAALRSGLISGLVTHASLARRLVDDSDMRAPQSQRQGQRQG
jgi:DNA-binding transcriptional regulator LsrR (DeoR family)